MSPGVDVLIPTKDRPYALAMVLVSLAAQTEADLRIVVSDQSEGRPAFDAPEVAAAIRILEAAGRPVIARTNLPRRGMAEQRQFLLDLALAPRVLFLDDDVVVEPTLVARLRRALDRAGCGFVGSAPIGLSFQDDVRPHEQRIEFWDDEVQPETVRPGGPGWERHRLHNAANIWHVGRALPHGQERLYRVAWIGACVMYDADKLRRSGGFRFWQSLPLDHAGEDVLAQHRVMARFGGAGLLPSGAFHLELPTTIPERSAEAHALAAEWLISDPPRRRRVSRSRRRRRRTRPRESVATSRAG
jgi:glycosyltransferase involved in cell wall biosynthesis